MTWFSSAFAALAVMAHSSGAVSAADAISDVLFDCDDDKTIAALFLPGKVDLVLDGERRVSLPQTRSGSGIRYANADETIVFWSKGNTAFLTEGDSTPYAGCIVIRPAPPAWNSYASSRMGFSLRYPPGYTVDDGYVYQGLGPGQALMGVSFTIPTAMTVGTNLAADTRLSVEIAPRPGACSADRFLPSGSADATIETEDGTDYSIARMSDAGAGNLYETTVYALVGTDPCLALRYLVHSTNIANYDPGTVAPFDATKLGDEFDAIRRSLVIGR